MSTRASHVEKVFGGGWKRSECRHTRNVVYDVLVVMEDTQRKTFLPQEGASDSAKAGSGKSLSPTPQGIGDCSKVSGGSKVVSLLGATSSPTGDQTSSEGGDGGFKRSARTPRTPPPGKSAVWATLKAVSNSGPAKPEYRVLRKEEAEVLPPSKEKSLLDLQMEVDRTEKEVSSVLSPDQITEDNKRKRKDGDDGEDSLKPGTDDEGISFIKKTLADTVQTIEKLGELVKANSSTQTDIKTQASILSILALRMESVRMMQLLEELNQAKRKEPKVAKLAKGKGVEIGTQTDPEPGRFVPKTYIWTKVVEGSPLTIEEGEYDLAVMRRPSDPTMQIGIQRLFAEKYAELRKRNDEVVHLKTSTWVMGDEEEVQKDCHIFRLDEGNKQQTMDRLTKVLDRMVKNNRHTLAIAWDDDAKTSEFRDLLEELAAKRGINVAIQVKARKGVKVGPKERTFDTDVIFVKKTEGATYAGMLKQVKDEVSAKGLMDTVRGVRETKEGDLMITVDKSQASKAQNERIREALAGKLGTTNIRMKSERPGATVFIKDIDALTNKAEIEMAIRTALGDGAKKKRVEVVSLRPAFAGTQNATINIEKEDEDRLVNLKFVRVGMPNCRILPSVKVDTCSRCWLTGHEARDCKEPDRTQLCRNCGEEGHTRKECANKSKCVVCGRPGHPANTTRCKLFRMELKAAKRREGRWTHAGTPTTRREAAKDKLVTPQVAALADVGEKTPKTTPKETVPKATVVKATPKELTPTVMLERTSAKDTTPKPTIADKDKGNTPDIATEGTSQGNSQTRARPGKKPKKAKSKEFITFVSDSSEEDKVSSETDTKKGEDKPKPKRVTSRERRKP